MALLDDVNAAVLAVEVGVKTEADPAKRLVLTARLCVGRLSAMGCTPVLHQDGLDGKCAP